jgi:hypothetical protein
MHRLATDRVEVTRRFYGVAALLLHPDDRLVLLDVLRSVAEHYRLSLLAGDAARPALDEEPEWPLLELDTARHRERQEREQGAFGCVVLRCFGLVWFGRGSGGEGVLAVGRD